MARAKKVVDETKDLEQVVDETVETKEVEKPKATKVDETKALKEELAKKDAENKAMQEQLAQLQQMMLQMQSNQNMILASNVGANNAQMKEEKVRIKSYLYGKNTIANMDRSTLLTFYDSGDVVTVSNRVLDSIMKPETKELFRKGLLEFVGESEKYYDEYDIAKPFVLSDENIIELLKLPKQRCIEELDKLTNNKTDSQIVIAIFWNAIRLFAKNTLYDSNAKYLLAEYFDCPRIDDRIEMCHYAKTKGFLK